MKQHIPIIIIVCLLLTFCACNRKSKAGGDDQTLHENCLIKHDPGPCRMNIKRYYYDARERKCKEFIYGGCEGMVPFETMKECRIKCGCE